MGASFFRSRILPSEVVKIDEREKMKERRNFRFVNLDEYKK